MSSNLQQATNFAIESEREVLRRKRLHGEIEDSIPSTFRHHLNNRLIWDPPCKKYKTVHNINNKITPVRNPRGKFTCYTCGKENHTSRNCPDRKLRHIDRRSNHFKRERPYPIEERKVKCDYCSNTGHTRSESLLRRAEEAEKALERLK